MAGIIAVFRPNAWGSAAASGSAALPAGFTAERGTFILSVDSINVRDKASTSGNKASWADNTVVKTVKKGEVFTIVGRQKVEGVYMYKLKSGYWITSSEKYVKYRTSIESSSAKKSVDAVAKEVLAGKRGNGQDRVNRLKAAGYDPAAVQAKVNQLLK